MFAAVSFALMQLSTSFGRRFSPSAIIFESNVRGKTHSAPRPHNVSVGNETREGRSEASLVATKKQIGFVNSRAWETATQSTFTTTVFYL